MSDLKPVQADGLVVSVETLTADHDRRDVVEIEAALADPDEEVIPQNTADKILDDHVLTVAAMDDAGPKIVRESGDSPEELHVKIIAAIKNLKVWHTLAVFLQKQEVFADVALGANNGHKLVAQLGRLRRLDRQWSALGHFDRAFDAAWLGISKLKKGKSEYAQKSIDRTFSKSLRDLETKVWKLWAMSDDELRKFQDQLSAVSGEVAEILNKIADFVYVGKCAHCGVVVKGDFRLCRICSNIEAQKRVEAKTLPVIAAKANFQSAWMKWVDAQEKARGREVANLALEVAFRGRGVEVDSLTHQLFTKAPKDISDVTVSAIALKWNSLAAEIEGYVCNQWPRLSKSKVSDQQADERLTAEEVAVLKADPDLADINFDLVTAPSRPMTPKQADKFARGADNARNKKK